MSSAPCMSVDESQDGKENLSDLHELPNVTCSNHDFDGFVSREVCGCILHAEFGPIVATQPVSAHAQIYLAVAPIEGPIHESLHLVAVLVDSLVLRPAPECTAAFVLGGVKRAQCCQQPANGAVFKAELDFKRDLRPPLHFVSLSTRRQVSSFQTNTQLDLA